MSLKRAHPNIAYRQCWTTIRIKHEPEKKYKTVMSVIVVLYNSVFMPVLESGILNAQSVSEFIIKAAGLTKKTPKDFQIFIQTMFHHSIMYINNEGAVGYDDFKIIIIRDYIEISFDRHTQTGGNPVNEFAKITQIRPVSCILSRLLCDYLYSIKFNENPGSPSAGHFD